MKFFTRSVDRFCAKHPRFGIPNLMVFLIIGNAVVFLFASADKTGNFIYYLAFFPSEIISGEVWRIITFIFIPDTNSFIYEALILYFYYFIGSNLENTWGSGRFTIFYLTGIVINVIFGLIIWLVTGVPELAGNITASYLNLSMFFAFATLYPDTQILLFFIIPIKVKWLALLDAAYFLYVIISLSDYFPINLLPFVAVLNYLLFCGDDLKYVTQSLRYRLQNRSGYGTTGGYRQAEHRSKRGEAQPPYTHKCTVCGRTNTDHPDLEFRYCSRCLGYHCFCEDHINNHVHFKE